MTGKGMVVGVCNVRLRRCYEKADGCATSVLVEMKNSRLWFCKQFVYVQDWVEQVGECDSACQGVLTLGKGWGRSTC